MLNKGALISSSYPYKGYQVACNYENRLGILSDVKNLYLEGINSINEKHILGIKLYSEQETSLFRKTKFQLTYGYKINIADKTSLTLAGDIGGVNIFFGSSDNSSGGSAWSFNGNASTTFSSEKTEVAVSLVQIPYQSLMPINYSFLLMPFFLIYAHYTLSFGPNVKWTTGARAITAMRWDFFWDNKLTLNEEYGLLLTLSERYSAGLFYTYDTPSNYYQFIISYEGLLGGNAPSQNQVSVGIILSGKN